MLVGITFENFASFFNETQFSLTSCKRESNYKDINTFQTAHGELLKSCVMFGANGSGKSNFISAVAFIKAVITSDLDEQCRIISNQNYFLFNVSAKNKPSKFSVCFIIDDIMYDYGFSILNGKIIYEYLDKKEKRTVNVFTRSGSKYDTIKLRSKDFKNVEHLIKNTREDALFLSWANFGNNETAMRICKWFGSIQVFNAYDTPLLLSDTVNYIQTNDSGKENVVKMMRNFGFPIDDFELELTPNDINELLMNAMKKSYRDKYKELFNAKDVNLKIKQKVYSENWEEYQTQNFGFDIESAGTRKVFEIAGPLLSALNSGSVVLIDELDSRLHPELVRHLVMMFNSISENPKNAQLICNTHNVNLLDEDIRRDQIYFLEKDEHGVSDLYSLSDFKGVRKDSKVLKQYLLGMYGAIPVIDKYNQGGEE